MVMGKHPPLSAPAQRRLMARITALMEEKKFHLTQIRSRGPRYFLASGTYHGRPAIFKMTIRPIAQERLTNEKLGREYLFLSTIQKLRSPLSRATPRVWHGGISPHAWYIREEIRGTGALQPHNETKYVNSFFNQSSQRQIGTTLASLQQQKISVFPKSFQSLLYSPQLPSFLWKFIAPYAQLVDTFMQQPGFAASCRPYFMAADKVFKRAPRVLAHQELYPAHFLRAGKQWKIIDWENIGWALPTYDYVAMWLRAHERPRWQAAWQKHYEHAYRHYPDAKRLWDMTVFIQSLFNVVGYHFYPRRAHFSHLARAAAKQLRQYPQFPSR
ncbi:MAG: phosphotransferase [Candidatus Kerfeldbacteria bacterium]|nr:phosphotransferase [Candidatus Kerfeldbacteria bacterium]